MGDYNWFNTVPLPPWPVHYELVPVKQGEYPHYEGQVWAEADVDHAAHQMREIVERADLRTRKTLAAAEYIRTHFSTASVALRLLARLNEIEKI
jgi:hypothetical protein